MIVDLYFSVDAISLAFMAHAEERDEAICRDLYPRLVKLAERFEKECPELEIVSY